MSKLKDSVQSQGIVNLNSTIVWDKLIAFGGTEKFVPALIEKVDVKGDGVGAIRTIHLKGGGEIIEKLTSIDAQNMEMKFIIISTPMPIWNYEGILKLKSPDDENCNVLFISNYEVLQEQKVEMHTIIKDFQKTFLSNLDK